MFVQLIGIPPLQEQDLLTTALTFCAEEPKEFCAKASRAWLSMVNPGVFVTIVMVPRVMEERFCFFKKYVPKSMLATNNIITNGTRSTNSTVNPPICVLANFSALSFENNDNI